MKDTTGRCAEATKRAARTLSFGGAERVTLCGRGYVLVEGQRGLEEYGPQRLVILLARGRLVLRGEALCLEAMSATELAVRGELWAVEFE